MILIGRFFRKEGWIMKRLAVVLFVAMLSFAFLIAPANLEARGGRGGGGGRGGFHGGVRFHGGSWGGHYGGYHGSYHGVPGYRGTPGYRGRFFGYVPFLGFGAGFLAGYWSDGYYYTHPYHGVCQRWIPTGGYQMESRQDPNTGAWEEVQVPDGYWEVVPCD
jgi:hypothetical protein